MIERAQSQNRVIFRVVKNVDLLRLRKTVERESSGVRGCVDPHPQSRTLAEEVPHLPNLYPRKGCLAGIDGLQRLGRIDVMRKQRGRFLSVKRARRQSQLVRMAM